MIVYLNRGCRCTPTLNSSLVRKLPEKFGPGALHHILRETVQQIVNCAVDPSFVFKKVDPGTLRILSITGMVNQDTVIFLCSGILFTVMSGTDKAIKCTILIIYK